MTIHARLCIRGGGVEALGQIAIIDVRDAPQSGWSLGRIGEAIVGFAVSQAIPVVAGWTLIEFRGQWLLGGAIIAISLATWCWIVLIAPAAKSRRISAYGSSLAQIRSALAPLRARSARYRGGWLLLNGIAAAGALATLSFAPDYAAPWAVALALLFALNGVRLWSDQGGVRQTAGAYVWLAAIWGAFLALMGVLTTVFEPAQSGGMIGVLLVAGFWFAIALTGGAWARSRISLEGLRKRDPRAPILFLRSFEDEGKVEANLREVLRPYGPFIAVGKPGELRPEGAARTYFEGEAWRPAILKLMDEARLIVAVPGLTGGLDWEMKRLAERNRHKKAVYVLLADNSDRRIANLIAALAKTGDGDALSGAHADLGAIAFLGPESVWTSFETIRREGEWQAALEVAIFALQRRRETPP